METGTILKQLHSKLQQLDPAHLKVTVGFDGFVDEIVEVVDRRESFDSYTRMTTISQFGERILQAAGLSTNIEFVSKAVKLGGNGPIMGNALVKLGTSVSYIGALGRPNLHPVFKELADSCTQVYSIAQPGHTDAVEFDDGKVMLGKMEGIHEVTWDAVKDVAGEAALQRMFSDCDLAATLNWTMTPGMNGIWQGLLDLIQPRDGVKPFFFVDLCDPGKRSDQDILEALELISEFSRCFRVILGLNRKEATAIAEARRLALSRPAAEVELEEIVQALGEDLGFWCVVVHPTYEAGAYLEGNYAQIPGPFTSKPRLTTGAGDNFNAGFCLGLMLGLGLTEALALGKATSGFYVREMRSPSWQELQDFLALWADKVGEEF